MPKRSKSKHSKSNATAERLSDKHLSRREIVALNAYIRQLSDLFGLRDWTIKCAHEFLDGDDAAGQIVVIEGRYTALISVSRSFFDTPAEDQRNTIVHELVHCHLDRPADVVRIDLSHTHALSESEHQRIYSAYHRAVEYATDAIASAVDKFMPLPSWGKLNGQEKSSV